MAQIIVTDDVFHFTITDLDIESPYVVLVWAFTILGDQEPARVELEARGEHCSVRVCQYFHL